MQFHDDADVVAQVLNLRGNELRAQGCLQIATGAQACPSLTQCCTNSRNCQEKGAQRTAGGKWVRHLRRAKAEDLVVHRCPVASLLPTRFKRIVEETVWPKKRRDFRVCLG